MDLFQITVWLGALLKYVNILLISEGNNILYHINGTKTAVILYTGSP